MAPEIGYIIRRSRRNEFHHLYIEVINRSVSGCQTLCMFTWQGDTDFHSSSKTWYGFKITVENESAAVLKEGARVAARLIKDSGFYTPPTEIIAALKARHSVRLINDARLGKTVPVAEVLPPTIQRWVDDSQRLGNRYATCDCLAETEAEAQEMLTAKITDYDTVLGGKFVAAGKPVTPIDTDRPPIIIPLEELLLPPTR